MSQHKAYVDQLTGRAPYNYEEPPQRSNLLFISTDMVPPEYWNHSAYRDIRRTPALDSLRQDGTFFTNAFSTAPVCSPARAAYLTGRHSYIMTNSERGHDGHAMHLRNTDTIFPEYLASEGYHTRHIGKSHVGSHKFMDAFGENDSPWDRWSPPWFDDDRYLAYLRALGFGPISFDRAIQGASPTGRGRGNHYGGWIAPQNGRAFPIEGTYPWYLVEKAIETLQSKPDDGTPFYLQLDFFAPHQPFAIPGDMEERERELRRSIPDPLGYAKLEMNDYNAPWTEPRVYTLYRKNWGLQDRRTVEDYMVANVLQYEVIDAALQRLFEHLRGAGLYESTTVMYTADHGEMNCNLGLIDKGAFLNPHVLRVPFIVKPSKAHASEFTPGGVEAPVSLLDVAATFCELAGVEPLDRLDGVPLQHVVSGQSDASSRPVVAEVWSHVVANPCVATVFAANDGHQYLFSFNVCDAVSELYRLDPTGRGAGELENLFLEPEYEAVRKEAIRYLDGVLASDERWKGYHAYSQLVFAEYLEGVGDMQRFL
jgi:arylsulfatase A-like enzyme